jgi:hypothetical protein
MRFALLDVSARSDVAAALPRIAQAGVVRGGDIAAAWSPVRASVAPCECRVVDAVSKLANDDVPILFTPTIDDAGALAYHTQRGSYPYGLVLCDAYQTIDSICAAALHEIGETQVDPQCDGAANGDCLEVYDPTQGDSQPIPLADGSTVPCAPFVYPSWFGLGVIMPGTPTNSAYLPLEAGAVRPGGYKQRADGSEVLGMGYMHPPQRLAYHGRRAKRARARMP